MKKIVIYSFGIILIAGLLASCSGNKLAESFDEETVISAAEEMVALMNEADYETITNEKVREDLREALSVKVLENAAGIILNNTGNFDSFQKKTVVGQKDKSTGEDYAVAILVTKYEKKRVIYTISFNTDMQVIGFYMK
jgi:hypothetical protein